MPTFVFTSPDGKEHEVTGPEGATEDQAFQMLQSRLPSEEPQKKELSIGEHLKENYVDPHVGLLYGMGSMARDTGARIGQVARSVGEATGLSEPGSRAEYTREHDKEIADRKDFLSGQTEGFRSGAKMGEFVQSVAQVPIPAASLAGRAAVGTGFGALQYVPEGDTTLGFDSDIANPVLGGTLGAVAPYIVRGGAELVKGVGNVGRGILAKLRGESNSFSALKEQGYPIARQLAGLNDIQTPNATALKEFNANADEIAAATGKRPEALLSQQLGSDRAAKAEAATAASPAITDSAYNERQRLIKLSLDAADDIASKLNKGHISPERGGKLLAASQNRAINTTWEDAGIAYRKEAKPIIDLFESSGSGPVIGQNNQLKALKEIEQTAAVQGQSNEKVFSAIKRTSETLSTTGNINLEAALSRRGSFSKQSTANKFLGIDDPSTAKQAAWKMAQAVEADIAEAAIKVSSRRGVPYPEEAIKRANAAYSAGAEKARTLEDNVFGTLLGKKNATFEDFTKAALNMPDSQFRNHMTAIREVNPNIDKQMGRFLMDKARVDAKLGPSAPSTAAGIDTNVYFSTLDDNAKFIATFPTANQKQVKAIMTQMHRLSDRVGTSGGGSSANPIAEQASQLQAGTSQDMGFLMKAAYRFVIGPMMSQALYTEAGRKALLVVGRDYLKPVPTSAYLAALKTLEGMSE